jgi:hypothetical protein
MGYTPPALYITKTVTTTTVFGLGTTTGDTLIIKSNKIDTYPLIGLQGGQYAWIGLATGKEFYLAEGATNFFKIGRATPDAVLSAVEANGNITLVPNGAGLVKFGTYTLGAAVASTGYITVLDALGNPRKLMVQA